MEVIAGTHGRNPEARTEAEAIGEYCLLACSLRLAQLVFYI